MQRKNERYELTQWLRRLKVLQKTNPDIVLTIKKVYSNYKPFFFDYNKHVNSMAESGLGDVDMAASTFGQQSDTAKRLK